MARLFNMRFGHLSSAHGAASLDGPLRSYVFQRDVVDYLAARFLNTARFLNPVLSTSDVPVDPALREEMEYGLNLEDYLAALAVEAGVPDHPEIAALAATPADVAEGRSQAQKIRSLMYIAQGLRELFVASQMIRQGSVSPQTAQQLEIAEVYFEGASKASVDGEIAFPEDPFYPAFRLYADGAARHVRATRLHAAGYFVRSLLLESVKDFSAVGRSDTFPLSKSKQSLEGKASAEGRGEVPRRGADERSNQRAAAGRSGQLPGTSATSVRSLPLDP